MLREKGLPAKSGVMLVALDWLPAIPCSAHTFAKQYFLLNSSMKFGSAVNLTFKVNIAGSSSLMNKVAVICQTLKIWQIHKSAVAHLGIQNHMLISGLKTA